MAQGIPATELDDETLERELRHLHATRSETFFNGSEDALDAHTYRMQQLEEEFLRRLPHAVAPDPMRVRASNRKIAGQD